MTRKARWLSPIAGFAALAATLGACGASDSGGFASSGKGVSGQTGSPGAGNTASNPSGSSAHGGNGSSTSSPNAPNGSGTPAATGPHFVGSGNGFRPLTTGCGPSTAAECTGACEQRGGDPGTTVVRAPATLCFSGDGDATPDDPAVVIEQVVERSGAQQYVHIRITFDPRFVDNTYGAGSCCGWPAKRGHRFEDLTKSDHTELRLTDVAGETVMNFKIDYITANSASSCGYGTLGASGGDGSLILGNPDHLLAFSTSLDRNLNACGYCASDACGPSGDCTVDSPATDENYTPNPATPNWDYRLVYEVWVDTAAFGDAGFGQAYITYTHASPSKSTDTINVTPSPCPPTWDMPYCPPNVPSCFGTPPGGSGGSGSGGGSSSGGQTSSGGATGEAGQPGSGGTGGSVGSGGSGGNDGTCPPNYQLYLALEGASTCTPIPFANYPDMAPCPNGYMLDLASEGQYCLLLRRTLVDGRARCLNDGHRAERAYARAA